MRSRRHKIGIQRVCRSGDGLEVWSPVAKVVLGIVEDLTGLVAVFKRGTHIAWYDRFVVQQIQKSPAMSSKNDLLLGPLYGGCKMAIVCLLELLTCLAGAC